jgi:hypothetical protein
MRFITNNLSTEHAGARAECWYGKDFEGNFANQLRPAIPINVPVSRCDT